MEERSKKQLESDVGERVKQLTERFLTSPVGCWVDLIKKNNDLPEKRNKLEWEEEEEQEQEEEEEEEEEEGEGEEEEEENSIRTAT